MVDVYPVPGSNSPTAEIESHAVRSIRLTLRQARGAALTRPHVVVVHYIVPDYRAVQLNIVRERLDRAGITLDVLYSSRYDQRRRARARPATG